MGMSAAEVDRLSMWQLMAQAEAFIDQHTPEKDRKMSVDEADSLDAWMDRMDDRDKRGEVNGHNRY